MSFDMQVNEAIGMVSLNDALFVKASSRFKSEITVARDDLEVNGKSIMGVMMLAAEEGATILVKAQGPDEADAVAALKELVDGKFGGEP